MTRNEPLLLEHCDPDAILRSAMTGQVGDDVATLFLAWLLRLPRDVDPAAAALIVLRSVERGQSPTRLERLLEETTRFPRERLVHLDRCGVPT